MKKRLLGVLLAVCMLATMIPVMATVATAEEFTPSNEAYMNLYVQDGLTNVWMAYNNGTPSYSVAETGGTWTDLKGGEEAKIINNEGTAQGKGSWSKGTKGGIKHSIKGYYNWSWMYSENKVAFADAASIDFNVELLNSNAWTVEYVEAYAVVDVGTTTSRYNKNNTTTFNYYLGPLVGVSNATTSQSSATIIPDGWAYSKITDGTYGVNHANNIANGTGALANGAYIGYRRALTVGQILSMSITYASDVTYDATNGYTGTATYTIHYDIDGNVQTRSADAATKGYAAPNSGYFKLMTAKCGTMYAVRIYNDVLTTAEMEQNHFVDILAYHSIDPTAYMALGSNGKAAAHKLASDIRVEAASAAMIEQIITKASWSDIDAPDTNDGASIKATSKVETTALRFTATLSKASLAAYEAIEGATVAYGMLITPTAYVTKAGAFTHEALNALGAQNGAYLEYDMTGKGYAETETDITLAAVVQNFSATTAKKDVAFSAIAYVAVTVDGATFYFYGASYASDALSSVVTAAKAQYGVDANEYAWLEALEARLEALKAQ